MSGIVDEPSKILAVTTKREQTSVEQQRMVVKVAPAKRRKTTTPVKKTSQKLLLDTSSSEEDDRPLHRPVLTHSIENLLRSATSVSENATAKVDTKNHPPIKLILKNPLNIKKVEQNVPTATEKAFESPPMSTKHDATVREGKYSLTKRLCIGNKDVVEVTPSGSGVAQQTSLPVNACVSRPEMPLPPKLKAKQFCEQVSMMQTEINTGPLAKAPIRLKLKLPTSIVGCSEMIENSRHQEKKKKKKKHSRSPKLDKYETDFRQKVSPLKLKLPKAMVFNRNSSTNKCSPMLNASSMHPLNPAVEPECSTGFNQQQQQPMLFLSHQQRMQQTETNHLSTTTGERVINNSLKSSKAG
jgi:hypothetical protein